MIAKSRTLTDRSARILQSDLEVGDFARFQGNPKLLNRFVIELSRTVEVSKPAQHAIVGELCE